MSGFYGESLAGVGSWSSVRDRLDEIDLDGHGNETRRVYPTTSEMFRRVRLPYVEANDAERGFVIECDGCGDPVYVPDDGPFLHVTSCGQTFERLGWCSCGGVGYGQHVGSCPAVTDPRAQAAL